MAERRTDGGALEVGPGGTRGWVHVRTAGPVPGAGGLRDRDGAWLSREPVGLPGRATLTAPPGTPTAAGLRVIKALALALARAERGGAGADEAWLHARITGAAACHQDPLSAAVSAVDGGLQIELGPAWLDPAHDLIAIRDAAMAAMRALPAIGAAPPPAPLASGDPKVLLFRNVFTKDVDRGDAHHVNPGVHHLISALHREGIATVLLDGKHPLQDVCDRPPEVHTPLRPDQVLTDPDELTRALADHPDLTLVALTVLERSFAQARDLCALIRRHTRAFIALGGVLPTLTPEHAFVHLPDADVLVRGDGEEALPALARALAGRTVDDGLDDPTVAALGAIEGLIARDPERLVAVHLDRVQCVADLDAQDLDFSFLERRNVESGISLSTSRGCVYACRFCSVLDKRRWRAQSAAAVLRQIDAYDRRLLALYGAPDRIPATARSLQIWDDDFFIDRGRAAAILGGLAERGFTCSFVQGTVSSFFLRDGRRISRTLDTDLLDAIPRALFTELRGLKLGTENFNDRELKRLGKPYDVARIRMLAEALARRGLPQDHYWIACNRSTTLDELLDNLTQIAALRWQIGDGFKVLQPSWLMNLFPTALYRSCQIRGTDRGQPTLGTLTVADYPEWDYPFVVPERPGRREVYEVMRRFPRGMHFGAAEASHDPYEGIYEEDDPDYTQVFGALQYTLQRLVERLAGAGGADAAAVRLRVDDALALHLGAMRPVPEGLLRRLAPGLPRGGDPGAASRRLLGYLDALLAEARRGGRWSTPVTTRIEGDTLMLTLGTGAEVIELGVEPAIGEPPCAFTSRNLAFTVRSGMDTDEQRDAASGALETFRDLIRRLDRAPLD